MKKTIIYLFVKGSLLMKIMITGGAGFIGSALIRYLMQETSHSVLNLDKLTYSGNLDNLSKVESDERYQFQQVDICDRKELERVFNEYKPTAVMHLAAESHVDRSIDNPEAFIETNILGTYRLLEVAKSYWGQLEGDNKQRFRFHHVSTDEVYGDLETSDDFFTEDTPYSPSSPYSASKASSDHLVRSWYRTFGFPVLISNCSNNYGPYQFPEKLIPLMILNALKGKKLPVYGQGKQIRDWLYVDDHIRALCLVLEKGNPGETYNIGGKNEKENIEVVLSICDLLEELVPIKPTGVSTYRDLITYVTDRPGHDQRYAVDANKIQRDLGWSPSETFETGLKKTVQWYLNNESWLKRIHDGSYRGERLGLLSGGKAS